MLFYENQKILNNKIETRESVLPNEVYWCFTEFDKTEFETNKFVDYRQRFQFFLSLSLFFIIADVFLFETKTKWIQKLNLFNEK